MMKELHSKVLALEPGASSVLTMESLVKRTGYNNVFAEIEDDEIMQDNRRYTTIFIPDKIPLMIFYDDEADTKFVDLALASSGNNETFDITKKSLQQLLSVNLNQYDVVFIIGSEITSNERLKQFVENGGGLFLFPGSKTTTQSFQKMLDVFSLPIVQGSFGEAGKNDNAVSFDKVEFNHPLFSNLFNEQTKKKIESPDIYHHLRIDHEGKRDQHNYSDEWIIFFK